MTTRFFGAPIKRNEDKRLLTGQALFICAVAGLSRLMPNEIANTIASGASMNTHFSGLTYIA